ncbi:hypothetical protein ANCCAN_22763 [Ancylostoma caninum]|uniref:G-protein coupled receptors family 1 profile domain-containing protein n=1 Tax=Ancylostoma caninum TaxID=29170 RepID=A0A368FH43_ANCCA|nr:hypothetical protein ANCCAN_22763 [Ancylostoma caninum]
MLWVNWFTLPLLVYAMLTRAQKRARHEDGPATPSVHTRAKKRVRHVSKKSPKLEISPPTEQANQASENESAAKTTSEAEEHIIENTNPNNGAGEAADLEEQNSSELSDAREPEPMGPSGDHQE